MISEQSRRTLLSLACTCQAFKEPALEVMWRYQDDLTCILKLMRTLELDETTRALRMMPALKLDATGQLVSTPPMLVRVELTTNMQIMQIA